MTSRENPMGKIYILPKAIKTVVRDAALQSYGVIGLAPGNVRQSFVKMFNENYVQQSTYSWINHENNTIFSMIS